jgi:hypothetical protein
MVKYYAYDLIKTPDTILEFSGGDDDAKVSSFTGIPDHVVSVMGEDLSIAKLVASQSPEINLREITHDVFRDAVTDSDQIAQINRQVKHHISQRYDVADEVAVLKLDISDTQRIDYNSYILDCKNIGRELKVSVGYLTDTEQLDLQAKDARDLYKDNRDRALNNIVVTISTGKTFDGDETSQDRMARAILTGQATGQTETSWTLADNTSQVVTIAEMVEALALSLQKQSELWFEGV